MQQDLCWVELGHSPITALLVYLQLVHLHRGYEWKREGQGREGERGEGEEGKDYRRRLAVWLSGNALASINVVALRQTRLVPGWMTVCGRVINHLGM